MNGNGKECDWSCDNFSVIYPFGCVEDCRGKCNIWVLNFNYFNKEYCDIILTLGSKNNKQINHNMHPLWLFVVPKSKTFDIKEGPFSMHKHWKMILVIMIIVMIVTDNRVV